MCSVTRVFVTQFSHMCVFQDTCASHTLNTKWTIRKNCMHLQQLQCIIITWSLNCKQQFTNLRRLNILEGKISFLWMQHSFELFRQWWRGEKTKRATLEGSLENWEKLRSGRSPLNTRTLSHPFPSHSLRAFSKRELIKNGSSDANINVEAGFGAFPMYAVMVTARRSPHDLRLDRSLLMTVPCSPGTSSSSTSCS